MSRDSLLALIRDLVRPFTLLPPLLGMLSGALCALGAVQLRGLDADFSLGGGRFLAIFLGALMAATLNAGSNAINQVADLENDRLNKPDRPLPAGRLSQGAALAVGALFYALALTAAWLVGPPVGGLARECFWFALGGAAASLVYSLPPLRTKRWAWPAQATIAISRGLLLRLCGWSCVATAYRDPEPWFSGAVFLLFLLGAAATKDFADSPGDRAAGCRTWPVVHGPRGAARRIAPFLVLPWLILPLGAILRHPRGGPLLAPPAGLLCVLGVALATYGCYVAWLMLRRPDELTENENHPSWVHMYRMMMLAQLGLAAAYIYPAVSL